MSTGSRTTRYTFPRSRRLTKRNEYQRVLRAKAQKPAGPLRIHGAPNERGHPRLGLTVSRKVGKAVRRNHIKRMLREAFRLLQHELPQGYDYVVVVRPHEPANLEDYQAWLTDAAQRIDRLWQRRAGGNDSPGRRVGA